MNSLFAKLTLLLAAAFLACGGVLLMLARTPVGPLQGAALWADIAIGAVVCALLAALGAAHLVTRRLKRLADAADAFARGAHPLPLHVDGADAGGDEVARLAAQLESMAERIGTQAAALERVERQQRELLAKVSHDLRTPLASMQGYLELLLLRHGSLDRAEERNYLEIAVRQGEKLTRLVGDLFSLSELESGTRQPQREAFALAELTQDVVQRFAADARQRRVQLHCEADASPQVLADIGLVERVFESLVDNALRHTPAGGTVCIAIDCDVLRAQVAVRDSGEGIAAADLAGLFENYERAERVAHTGAMARGGLGLAIARRIVHLHGGELQVRSTAGVGTEVHFDLPLAAATPGADAAATRHRAASLP
jgi:signal transduction histidine kinase